MESILSGGQDFLLPGLSYDLSGDQASYVVSRRQSQINSNVPTAGPNDVRQVTFNIADPQRIFGFELLVFSMDGYEYTCYGSAAATQCSPTLLLE